MSWVNLKLQDCFDISDLLCFKTILKCKGALDVAFENKQGEYLSDEIDTLINTSDKLKITALFDDISTASLAKIFFSNAFKLDSEIKDTVNKNWKKKVIAEFTPSIYGNKLCIHPSWKQPPEDILISMCIDAEQDFGNSTHPHPATELCLEWLVAEPSISNSYVINYGCGSGILSIATALLGAKNVAATDTDPQAVAITKKNAINNKIIAPQLQTYLSDQLPEIQADIIIANIIPDELIKLKSTFAKLAKPNANILLSSISIEDKDRIINEFTQAFEFKLQLIKNDWVLLNFKVNNSSDAIEKNSIKLDI